MLGWPTEMLGWPTRVQKDMDGIRNPRIEMTMYVCPHVKKIENENIHFLQNEKNE